MNAGLTQGYIRHPQQIPADVSASAAPAITSKEALADNHVGISFTTQRFYASGKHLKVCIKVSQPYFSAVGKVAWCIPEPDGSFTTGIVFDGDEIAYSARMAEQICHIEQYRRDIECNEGRKLSAEAAAAEWIVLYAHDFPGLNSITHR
ncbi:MULTISPECIES: hypothetical protein [Neptunomonas]|uniref:PilZ domain-containing protein n=1 Tax=Neptunomonas marina TaxID=1815562 RepID=A0A437Q7M7_9GAMM|nr:MULTISPECIES: hypothetical protein [Neptunomonas]RVU30542.1 hypothetical protein EOE65_09470 [Neptunomonas marina]